MYKRRITDLILDYLSQFPAVCLLEPRQAGKTTLARRHIAELNGRVGNGHAVSGVLEFCS